VANRRANGRRLEYRVPINTVNRCDDKTRGKKAADHYFYWYWSNVPHACVTSRIDASSTWL